MKILVIKLSKKVKELYAEMKGQTAIVTGVSSGLGVEFAEALAEYGVNLIVAARRYEKLVKVADDISSEYGVKVVPVKTDISQEDQVINMVKTAMNEFGSLEILVNNAGMGTAGLNSVDMGLQEWERMLNTDLTGTFLCARTAAREMIKGKYGRIVNIASIYGATPDPGFPFAAYDAAKGGVINLTRSLAKEWTVHNINVNGIAPGCYPSEATQQVLQYDEIKNAIISRTPLKRLGEPYELKAALILLASPASSFITGQTMFVDGGYTII